MNKKTLLTILGAVLVIAAVGFGLYNSGMFGNSTTPAAGNNLSGNVKDAKAAMQTLYTSLQNECNASGAWKAEMRGDKIALVDAGSGKEVAFISHVSDQEVDISGVVTNLDAMPADAKQKVESQISEFNTSSPVGTMRMDGGNLVMMHRLNPQMNSAEQMAKTVVKFGDVAKQQAQKVGVAS
ncbi:MAG: hypothetical protein JNJ94_12080 [Chlorobi bacterium]|nr:hypothetical protein [Chlorobiota bacterium]